MRLLFESLLKYSNFLPTNDLPEIKHKQTNDEKNAFVDEERDKDRK